MTIKQNGGIFGRNPSFKSIELDGTDLETTLDAKADLSGDTFTGQVNINTSGTGGLSVTAAGNGEIVASRTSGASVKIQSQSARGLIGTTSNHGFRLIANGAQYVDLSTSGNLEVMSGNLKIGTSGKGIDFSATSGTGTSELFDDYEEGTWTPTFQGSTSGSISFASAGYYTKIGRIVRASFYLTSKDFSAAAIVGTLEIAGLPYNVGVLGQGLGNLAVNNFIAGASDYVPYAYSTDRLRVSKGNTSTVTDADLTQSTSRAIAVSITYMAS
jgi:hypothetical protein